MRYPLQAIVSLGQVYGDVLYYATSLFDHYYKELSYCRPEAYYFWFYFVFMNFIWIVIPGSEYKIQSLQSSELHLTKFRSSSRQCDHHNTSIQGAESNVQDPTGQWSCKEAKAERPRQACIDWVAQNTCWLFSEWSNNAPGDTTSRLGLARETHCRTNSHRLYRPYNRFWHCRSQDTS